MKKNSICKIIVSGLLAVVPLMGMAQQVCGNKPWSVRMAESEMVRCPESWQLDFQTRLKWDYCHGLELQA
ncbi:glycosyl hydrolase family 88, partial [Phocaeicola vulgatus]|nr:glycosyl hydrolase family 88 [Phocaeicola vulgatus]